MKTHHYQVTNTWTGNLGKGTKDYRSYSRDHLISAQNKAHEILGASDPAFRGDPSRYNPEELFVASISTCHMLWFLHLCASNKIIISSYVDKARGTMEEGVDGSGRFTQVTLYPKVIINDASQIELANQLHEEANKMCFIANSCNFPVLHKPITEIAVT